LHEVTTRIVKQEIKLTALESKQMALTTIPASKLSGTSLPSTIGLGTRLDAVDMTSTTTITGIPSTAKMLIIGVANLSPTANSAYGIQLGTSGGLTTSGYQTNYQYIYDNGSDNEAVDTTSIAVGGWSASGSHELICTCYNVTGNIWTYSLVAQIDGTYEGGVYSQGGVTLGGSLDRVGWAVSTGAFDAGTMSLTYY